MVTIEKAVLNQEEEITKIYNKATLALIKKGIYQWKFPFFNNEIKNEILLDHYYVIKSDDKLIGCFGIKKIKDDLDHSDWDLDKTKQNYYWYKLVIDPDYQGQGVYYSVLAFIKEFVWTNNIKMYLTCYSSNQKTNRLYLDSGFRLIRKKLEKECDPSLKDFFEYNIYAYSV